MSSNWDAQEVTFFIFSHFSSAWPRYRGGRGPPPRPRPAPDAISQDPQGTFQRCSEEAHTSSTKSLSWAEEAASGRAAGIKDPASCAAEVVAELPLLTFRPTDTAVASPSIPLLPCFVEDDSGTTMPLSSSPPNDSTSLPIDPPLRELLVAWWSPRRLAATKRDVVLAFCDGEATMSCGQHGGGAA